MSVLQRPQPRPGVLAIDPYVPGRSTAPGVARVFKLSSNETPLGPSPKAVAAYHAVGEHLQDYPDGDSTALREAIGRTFGRPFEPDRRRLSARRRRGYSHHPRVPGLPDRHPRLRRDADRGGGKKL